jgi:hypothetical protein
LPDPPQIFTGLLPEFLKELEWPELLYLSDLARATTNERRYLSLGDALRKLQWARLSAVECGEFERMTEEELSSVGTALLYEPIGQLRHQKARCDFVAHCKASLDALTVFLVQRLDIPLRGGGRDLRRQDCRDKISAADTVIGLELRTLNH